MFVECVNFANGLFYEFNYDYTNPKMSSEKIAVRLDQILAYKDGWIYLMNGEMYPVEESYDEISEILTTFSKSVWKDVEKCQRESKKSSNT